MAPIVCLTVDVEDWYEGMEVLGHPMPRPSDARSGLEGLLGVLDGLDVAVTLFTIGNYAATVRKELAALAAGGHEIASHGPDHGRLPNESEGTRRMALPGPRDARGPRAAPGPGFPLAPLRHPARRGSSALTETCWSRPGFDYVSDTSCLGPTSPISELPVLLGGHRLAVGGGGYQRFLPSKLVHSAIEHAAGTCGLLLPLL